MLWDESCKEHGEASDVTVDEDVSGDKTFTVPFSAAAVLLRGRCSPETLPDGFEVRWESPDALSPNGDKCTVTPASVTPVSAQQAVCVSACIVRVADQKTFSRKLFKVQRPQLPVLVRSSVRLPSTMLHNCLSVDRKT